MEMCMWIKMIIVVLMFGQVRSDSTYLSKACYGVDGITCTRHELNCTQHAKIAIEDAFFTKETCPNVGITACTNDSTDIADVSVYRRFNSTQLDLLYKKCSAKRNCIYKAPRIDVSPIKTLTVVKYECIEDNNTVRKCNGPATTGCNISLLFANLATACTCHIRREKSVYSGRLDFYLLETSLTTTPCTNLSIDVGGKESIHNFTTPFTPYMHLANGTHLTDNDTTRIQIEDPQKIWIQINGSENFTVTCNSDRSATPEPGPPNDCYNYHTTPKPEQKTTTEIDHVADSGANTGAVAGGVTVAVLVILAVVLVLLWFKYKRNQKPKPNLPIGKTSDEKYMMTTRMPDHNYHEIKAIKPKQPTSNYDYATVTREVNHAGKEGQLPVEVDYAKIGDKRPKVIGHNNTTLLTAKSYNNKSFTENEDDYNHLAANEEMKTIENGVHSGGYDTAVSASKYVQKIRNKEVSNVDSDCDYNHIDNNPKPNHLQGDYDTTASASKAVAKMMETKEQTEDDYDHFRQTRAGSQAADSPYDTAEHHAELSGDYSSAGVLQKNDPYDLAK